MAAKHFSDLRPAALDLVERSLNWMDQYWDEQVELLGVKSEEHYVSLPLVHHIRETGWYALGLLQRAGAHDKDRACRALQTLLKYQFDEPGKAYDGTWYRYPQEPHPGSMTIWRGYDPNWREFIGTTLAIILLDYESDLPQDLIRAIDEALRKAVRGTLTRDLAATYTNIALMQAFLLIFAGERFSEPAWISAGERMAHEVYQLFSVNQAFSEFNSPTYYGVDLYALGLWYSYSSSDLLKQLGAEMEQALWRDVALMYHAGMKNMSGPFDRSYGMDLQRYGSTIGMWIWIELGRQDAPFPEIAPFFPHALDLCFAPCYVAVDARVPEDVRQSLSTFQGEHQVERIISNDPPRIATAWIGNTHLIGGEVMSYQPPVSGQIHPATIHWISTQERIGWIKLKYSTPVNARAEKGKLTIFCIGNGEEGADITFQIYTPVTTSNMLLEEGTGALDQPASFLQPHLWQLPGLSVQIATNARHVQTQKQGDVWEMTYTAKDSLPGTEIYFVLTIP